MTMNRLRSLGMLMVVLPALTGARGDGCAANSRSDAPDLEGWWDITYDDSFSVEVTIGGALYTRELGPTGGAITIEHEGTPYEFSIDCSRPEVICPSEVWPQQVLVEQRNLEFEHRMIVTLPTQTCDGELVDPAAGACGADTNNPDCDQVCDGEVVTQSRETFGVIGETGESFRLYLGAGIATNGFNCALLGYSLADAALTTVGSADSDDWQATHFRDGVVTVGYAGGCLWAGDPDLDGDLEALVIGASIRIQTGFTGLRQAR